MKTDSKGLLIATIAYINIPIAIFAAGFVRVYFALFLIALLAVFVFGMIRDYTKDNEVREGVVVTWPVVIVAVAAITFICILLGFGGLFPQAGDWYKHNAVLKDLTLRRWPVYYDLFDDCMLTYYLGQYLLPALTGKLCGSVEVSNALMCVWGIFGVVLVYFNLVRIVHADTRLKQFVTLAILFLFGGALAFAQIVLLGLYGDNMNSLGSYHWVLVKDIMVQYRSNLVMLRWVFPQCIVPWLVTMLLIEHRRQCKHYVALILPTILYGSFSFAALVAIAVVEVITQILHPDSIDDDTTRIRARRKAKLRDVLSVSNIVMALSFGLVFFFYFLGYLQIDKPLNSSFRWQLYSIDTIAAYIVFCIFMFGIYAACTFRENKRDAIWYAAVGILLFLPWCRMGLCNDIVMSGSIPSLFILMIATIRLLFENKDVRCGIVIMCLVIGAWYPTMELRDNIRDNQPGVELADDYPTMEWFTNLEDTEVTEDLKYNYYTYEPYGKIFYEYIAAHKMEVSNYSDRQ